MAFSCLAKVIAKVIPLLRLLLCFSWRVMGVFGMIESSMEFLDDCNLFKLSMPLIFSRKVVVIYMCYEVVRCSHNRV